MPNPLESPMPIIVFGILAVAVLGIAVMRTGRGVLIVAMVGVLLLVIGGIALEWFVVTEVEEVEAVLYGTAAALASNRPPDDPDSVLQYISQIESPTNTRGEARRALRYATFEKVKISNLRIQIIETTSPPTATADFQTFVTARLKSGTFSGMARPMPIGFQVKLRKESGHWKIFYHTLKGAPAGF